MKVDMKKSVKVKELPWLLGVIAVCLLVTLIVFTVYMDEVHDKLISLFKSLDVKSNSIHYLKNLMVAGTVLVWIFFVIGMGGAVAGFLVRNAFVALKRDAMDAFAANGTPTRVTGKVPAFTTSRIVLAAAAVLVYIGALIVVGLVVVETLILADMKVIRLVSQQALAVTKSPAYAKIQNIQNVSVSVADTLNGINNKIADVGTALNSSVCGTAGSVASSCGDLTSALANTSDRIASVSGPLGNAVPGLDTISAGLTNTTDAINSSLCAFLDTTTSTCESVTGKLLSLNQNISDRLEPAVEIANGNSTCPSACFDVNALWFVKHKPNNTCICVVPKIQSLYDWSVDAKTASEAATICIVIYLALWLLLFWQLCTILNALVADWAWINVVLMQEAAEDLAAEKLGGAGGGGRADANVGVSIQSAKSPPPSQAAQPSQPAVATDEGNVV